jgi:hypothetical protein
VGLVIVPGLMGYYIASYLDFLGLQYIWQDWSGLNCDFYPDYIVV